MKTSHAALTTERDAFRATALKRAAVVKSLAARTTTVLAGRSSEALATLPIRAAPYIGVGALVTFTTLELKADCDLAKSIAELNDQYGNPPIDTGEICRAVEQVPSPQQAWSSVKASANSSLSLAYETLEGAATRLGFSTASGPPRPQIKRASP